MHTETREILRCAYELQKRGHTKGHFAVTSSGRECTPHFPFAVAYCITGALFGALTLKGLGHLDPYNEDATRFLCRAFLGMRWDRPLSDFEVANTVACIARWNDNFADHLHAVRIYEAALGLVAQAVAYEDSLLARRELQMPFKRMSIEQWIAAKVKKGQGAFHEVA